MKIRKFCQFDKAGPFEEHICLIVVDAYFKWLEVIPTTGATTKIMSIFLRRLFATHGLPDSTGSDNGTSFTGYEFQQFFSKTNIRLITSLPNRPATNAVKTFKLAFKKSKVYHD